MRTVAYILPFARNHWLPRKRFLLDSLLASTGSLFVTGLIAVLHLYPRIPNISMIYLLIVLLLATTRGRYAAILAALVAFLSFDFFLVPPLYTFVMYHAEEWIALFVLLITALLTGQLAAGQTSAMRKQAAREHELHMLYDLVRATNREEAPERQMGAIMRSLKEVLTPWGVQECTLFQPDTQGILSLQGSTAFPTEYVPLAPEEQEAAAWVLARGRMMMLYGGTALTSSPSANRRGHVPGSGARPAVCLVPLNVGAKMIGVLRLSLLNSIHSFPYEGDLAAKPLSVQRTSSFFWTFLDQVTALVERARLQQEAVRMAVLQRTDVLRAALLSSVSHDLRTPLTAIKAAASSLLQEVPWDDEARRGFANSIEHEADRLNHLVENLLDMSRIEEGALKPEKEEYSLTTLIHDVMDRLDALFAGRAVHVSLPDDLLLAEFDYLQIDQVLANLLENAVRHTPAGTPIEISAQLAEEEIHLSVADHGPGLPAAELERVFDKFYRVLHARQHPSASQGSGLGLAVCRGLVEAHGGRIWAESRSGGGLSVSVILPRREREREKR